MKIKRTKPANSLKKVTIFSIISDLLKIKSYGKLLPLSDFLCTLAVIIFLLCFPSKLFNTPTSFVVEGRDGNLMSASIASDGQWRFPVADSVPDKFNKCIIAFEDKRFWSHPGVDLLAIMRSVRQNIRAKKIISGGSTLTMQVIRLSRRKPRTIFQKLIELMLAFRLEIKYSKKEILELYVSNAPFGSNVVGLEAASWRYFGRDASTLSWGEMATLAVLPNSPSLVHPGKNSERLIRKRNDLLDKMVLLKFIDSSTAQLSKLEQIPGKPLPLPNYAPHLLSRFKSERKSLGINSTKIKSTLNEELQIRLINILKRYQYRYQSNGIDNIAALVLNVADGTVAGYVGNVYQPDKPEFESHVDMIRAKRSPGSTLKPILYAHMLNDGFILPKTLIADIPTQIAGYSPQNYDLGYDGAIPADKALSRSLNIPAVKMLQNYKYQRFYDKLKQMGFGTLQRPADHYGLSLILGGNEVTMWDLAKAYLGMARTLNHSTTYRGKYNPAHYDAPTYFVSKKKSEFKDADAQNSSILDHTAIWNTFNAMEEVMRPGEEGLWEQFSSSQRMAWKTGTSFGFRDAWAIGITPKHVICVWVGNADGEGRPGLTGIDIAAPVMFEILKQFLPSNWFPTPIQKLKRILVCRESGYKAGEYCEHKVEQLNSVTGEKTGLCPYHKLIHLDRTGNYRVTDQCEPVHFMLHKSWFVLPPAMEYYYKLKHGEYKELPPFKDSCIDLNSESVMEMIYPKHNTVVYVPLEFDGLRGKVIFNATHRVPNAKIFWHLDNEYLTTTQHYHQVEATPKPGDHSLTLVDENGKRLMLQFKVLDKEKKED